MTNTGSIATRATMVPKTNVKLISEAERRDHDLPSCNGTLSSSSIISVVTDVFHTSEGEDTDIFRMQRTPTLLQPMSMVPLHVSASMIPSPPLTPCGSELSSNVSLAILGAERMNTCLQPIFNQNINLHTSSIDKLCARTIIMPHSNPIRLDQCQSQYFLPIQLSRLRLIIPGKQRACLIT